MLSWGGLGIQPIRAWLSLPSKRVKKAPCTPQGSLGKVYVAYVAFGWMWDSAKFSGRKGGGMGESGSHKLPSSTNSEEHQQHTASPRSVLGIH